MAIVFPNMPPIQAEIHLDLVDSNGGSNPEMNRENARPMAVSLRNGEMWYGFVINDSTVDVIEPGRSAICRISFLNHEGAKEVFQCGSSILFGDGSVTRGVLRIFAFD